jgi:murein L,D-transpeptidase YcbB/YkuD
MRSARFDHLLAGTAVALALAVTPYAGSAFAAPESPAAAAVPTPEPANVPPPTASDVKPAPAAAAKPAADVTSSVPAAETPKATALSVGDSAIVDKLREQLSAGKFDRILGGKKERTEVASFYETRDFAPLWITNGAMNDRAKAVAAYLSHVDADGLEPADYPIPEIKAGAEPDALAEAEVRLTDTVLTYARHAMGGRVNYTRVSADIIYTLARPEPADVLGKLASSSNVADTLDSFEPQHPQYKALKAKLAELRNAPPAPAKAEKPRDVVHVPEGKLLRQGMSDPRVIAVRKRLDVPGDKNNPMYDQEVFDAVMAFQTGADIAVDGMLGPNTVRVMNGEKPVAKGPAINPVDVIIANMERWRWVPRDLGKSYVMVNIPDYSLRVVHDGKTIWKTKIVAGQPGKPTPLLSAEMKYITVNPTWNVPPSIIQNEYLPALQQDPQAMDRIGLKVEQNPDGTVRIWQPPGDRNALGRIRFNFPNKFLVYQHDTPDKYLFAKPARAYSHGCMRVENPLKYGEVVLGLVLPHEHYTAERLQKMFGGSEININFPVGLPDHLTYQTAFVEDGKLQIRDDVYGRDRQLLAILKSPAERKVADIAIDRPKGSSAAPVKMPPGTFGGGGGLFSGPSFFERLFGGSGDSTPRPRARVGERRASSH